MWIRFAMACAILPMACSCFAQVLWYGGDNDGFIYANNTVVQDGSGSWHVLDDFVVPAGTRWHVTGLFSNNVSNYPLTLAPFTTAEWSVRTGVSATSFGTVVYSGISPVSIAPTGRAFGLSTEYGVLVSGLSLDLDPGTYYMSVSPVTQSTALYSVGRGTAANRVGPLGPDGYYQEFIQTGPPIHTIFRVDPTGTASMGVIGAAVPLATGVPALSLSGSMLLLAALAIIAVRRLAT